MDLESAENLCNICMESKNNLEKCIRCEWKMCLDCYLEYIKNKDFCPHCKIKINDLNLLKKKSNLEINYKLEIILKNKFKIIFLIIFCFTWMITWIIFGCNIIICNLNNYNITV